jgi:iron-sulfur cluster repair protein YtfE (RIC family)
LAEAGDPLALAHRAGLPVEHRWLREELPRERWTDLHEVAAFWLQMHAGFRNHQAHMDGLVAGWRADGDLTALHRQLTPALQAFLQHLDGHHRVESGHYFPMMRKIEPRIGAGLDLLDRDHDAIHGHLEGLFQSGLAFHRAVSANAAEAADAAARLADRLAAAGAPLARHLDDEEDIVIPLIQLRGLPES